uniref:helix-turn-helix domain-containing protein n=1 Tax=Sandarakinorhabdus rubra TaxID=2672568 RepID=UPI0013DB8FE4
MVEEQLGLPDTASAGASAGASLSVGALLAEARAERGRELADLARETRVPLRHLMAIEADDHSALPALPYALGFVKAYARAVGLEPEAVGARFRAENRLAPHVPVASSLEPVDEARLPSRGLAWGALALLVLVLGGLGLYGSGAFDPPADTVAVARSETPPR